MHLVEEVSYLVSQFGRSDTNVLVFSLPKLGSQYEKGDQTVWYRIVPYLVEGLLAAGRGICYRMLVAATKMYGSGGQAAFGSLGVTDGKQKKSYIPVSLLRASECTVRT